MPKSVPYAYKAILRKLLRESRIDGRVTQLQLARRLGRPQNYVSKYEMGEKRLDILELREICEVLGISLPAFIKRLESAISKEARIPRPRNSK